MLNDEEVFGAIYDGEKFDCGSKKGFVHAALATRQPIVPIVVHKAAKIFPRGKLKFNPGPLDNEIPVSYTHLTLPTKA